MNLVFSIIPLVIAFLAIVFYCSIKFGYPKIKGVNSFTKQEFKKASYKLVCNNSVTDEKKRLFEHFIDSNETLSLEVSGKGVTFIGDQNQERISFQTSEWDSLTFYPEGFRANQNNA